MVNFTSHLVPKLIVLAVEQATQPNVTMDKLTD